MASTASPPILPSPPSIHPSFRFIPTTVLRSRRRRPDLHSGIPHLPLSPFQLGSAVPSNTAAHGTSSTIVPPSPDPKPSPKPPPASARTTHTSASIISPSSPPFSFSPSFLTLLPPRPPLPPRRLVLVLPLPSLRFSVVILGRTFSNREALFALLLTSFLVIFLTSVGSSSSPPSWSAPPSSVSTAHSVFLKISSSMNRNRRDPPPDSCHSSETPPPHQEPFEYDANSCLIVDCKISS
ncbi:hypothetical protein KSP39_PZI007221 [Platanthera zijinensis]|uniref:Uncharacterized protein n=1 Tax=Platanthera zijinensis TaxID=2320716 RepID=A0AAP0BQP1_9ASPA